MAGTNRDYLKHYIFLVAGLKAEPTKATHERGSDPGSEWPRAQGPRGRIVTNALWKPDH